jgi:pantothenate kinase-related protein Tda10
MTFQKFYDDIWRLKIHRALLFEANDFVEVSDWADENEDGLWADIPADHIVAIDTKHTDYQAKYFLAEKWLNAEVTNIIILSGCICIFLLPQEEQVGDPDRLKGGA